jgi:uncharacterized membrane protein
MGYDLNKHTIMLRDERRIFFKRQNIVRFTYPLAVMFGFFVVLSFISPALAASQSPSVSSCSIHLSSFTHSSADAARQGQYRLKDQRSVDQLNMPVQLGFLLGVRHALIPHTNPDKDQTDKHSIRLKNTSAGSPSHALAIAAYRACKKDAAMQQRTAHHSY